MALLDPLVVPVPGRAAPPTTPLHHQRPGVPLAADLAMFGDRRAVATEDGPVTYRQLAAGVAEATATLGPVRRLVLVAMANELEPITWYLAALAGGHPVLLADGADTRHLDALIDTYDPDIVIGPGAGGWAVDERRAGTVHDLHPDLALLLCTSGSTGSPKVVRLSVANVSANAESIVEGLGIRTGDLAATTLPLHYSYGLSVLHSHLLVGAGILLTDRSVVDRCFWRRFRAEGATTLAGVPHTFELLERAGLPDAAVPAMRSVTLAGGRLAPEAVVRWAERGRREGFDLHLMYGQTEATARMAILPADLVLDRPGAIGRPVPGGSFELLPIVDTGDGSLAGVGGQDAHGDGVGELVYRGANVMMGYATGPGDLATGPTLDALRTGDLARMAPDGVYELVGRRSRFIKRFGLRIDLDRVEAVLAARGVTSICTGDDGLLAIGILAGYDPADVSAVVAHHLGIPERSVTVVALAELPHLANGKPDRSAVLAEAAASRVVSEATGGAGAGVRTVFAEALRRPHVADGDTFAGLGGDSLSYVEVSLRLEQVLGHLPAGWHTMTVLDLERASAPGPGRRRRTTQVETNVVLRALAIVTVVGTHAGLFDRRGGAHVLLAVAGFNLARFQLGRGVDRTVGPMLRSAARIAVPAMLWIGGLVLLTDDYSLPTAFLLNGHLGSPVFDERWRYWFVEAVVQLMLVLALAFAFSPVRRAERRWPFAFPLGLTLLLLPLRYEVLEMLDVRHHTVQPQTTAWLFTLGWAAARASSTAQRALVTAVAVAVTPGFFFGDVRREALVAGGVVLLTWVPTVRVLRPLPRLLGPLASASLVTYLTHWHVFPAVTARSSPFVAVLASLVVGVAVWSLVDRLTRVIDRQRRRGRVHDDEPADEVRSAA